MVTTRTEGGKVKKLLLPLFGAVGALLAVLGGSGTLWP